MFIFIKLYLYLTCLSVICLFTNIVLYIEFTNIDHNYSLNLGNSGELYCALL